MDPDWHVSYRIKVWQVTDEDLSALVNTSYS